MLTVPGHAHRDGRCDHRCLAAAPVQHPESGPELLRPAVGRELPRQLVTRPPGCGPGRARGSTEPLSQLRFVVPGLLRHWRAWACLEQAPACLEQAPALWMPPHGPSALRVCRRPLAPAKRFRRAVLPRRPSRRARGAARSPVHTNTLNAHACTHIHTYTNSDAQLAAQLSARAHTYTPTHKNTACTRMHAHGCSRTRALARSHAQWQPSSGNYPLTPPCSHFPPLPLPLVLEARRRRSVAPVIGRNLPFNSASDLSLSHARARACAQAAAAAAAVAESARTRTSKMLARLLRPAVEQPRP